MIQEKTHEELLYATPEEWEFYNKIAADLPSREGKNGDGLDKFGIPIPYHSGPHIIKYFKETLDIVKPKNMIEIGFNMGHSAYMWLKLGNGISLCSMDVSEKDETIEAAKFLEDRYRWSFQYHNRNTGNIGFLKNIKIDLCFIDGAHDDENITKDILLTKVLNIPYILFDDWYPRYGETQVSVAKFPELELVKDFDNLRLYKANWA